MWRSFSSRDAAKIEPFFSENAVWIAPQDNATAKFLGERSGMSGRARIVRFILEQFPKVFARDVKLDFKGVYGDGETVVVELVLSATIANGRPYKNDYCFIHVLRDGKVAEIREFMDTYNGHRMIYGNDATI
jgi:ketosteroid isomerase-like protein